MSEEKLKKGKIREYAESLFIALLIAFFVRSFAIEAFRIPSGSMIPTLLIGDHIFVNKFIYGLRVPFTKKKIVHFGDPKRGEAIVFIYPMDEGKDFIKRVIGVPGDTILLKEHTVFLNGEPLKQEPKGEPFDDAQGKEEGSHDLFEENNGALYTIRTNSFPQGGESAVQVPPGHLFVMGDNRDNSSDSRDWGFVPIKNVKGKALFVWLSIDFENKSIRWKRFGKWIK